ncbi:hypothetical protein [Actinomadura bangladeshensis]|uniref:hypothetical protein n=1 Tax=Actinomadura bangladeshensis TaxID=453573 RepID=UPI001404844F|nr:hypothetical protein [Actinomadura bangladeshensis]
MLLHACAERFPARAQAVAGQDDECGIDDGHDGGEGGAEPGRRLGEGPARRAPASVA